MLGVPLGLLVLGALEGSPEPELVGAFDGALLTSRLGTELVSTLGVALSATVGTLVMIVADGDKDVSGVGGTVVPTEGLLLASPMGALVPVNIDGALDTTALGEFVSSTIVGLTLGAELVPMIGLALGTADSCDDGSGVASKTGAVDGLELVSTVGDCDTSGASVG